ncbi:MFS transporter [Chitinophaga pinensis]|uniref:Major facilitator superfamily MFS_1 n=1 Tax=Chitinophaga pinensis (strain ATCC 43595 / DSM 2588 / LMG 13176 / NBRC 15968 / NCIMB 11800 / UQM 2034) TaxID=485918 RepID=A0A979GQ30_CHIPD|nr:MFS transporter [Chitinophaga pinensis]ACU59643.1 major facilitator superfamily MFS_1 [Chitinophaga pinensis DSM 2588]
MKDLTVNLNLKRTHRIAASVFFFIAGLTYSSWACRIHDIKAAFSLNNAALGSVLFALPVGLIVSLPISGWLVTRVGSGKVLIGAGLLFPVMLVAIGLAPGIWQLVLLLFCFGFMNNVFEISMNTQAVGIEALYGRSIMASFHGLWSLAGFAGVGIGTIAISLDMPVLPHFLLICGICWLLVLFSYRYLLPADEKQDDTQPLFARPDNSILKLGLIAFSSLVTEGTMFDWSGIYFQKVVAVPEHLTTAGYIAFMSTMAGGRFIADRFVTRLGAKKVLQMSGIMTTSGLIISICFPYLITATIGFLLIGFGVSSVVPLVLALAGKSKTMAPGVAIAAVSTVGFFGFLLGPPMIGFISEATSLRWAFAIIALLGTGITLLASQAGKISAEQ